MQALERLNLPSKLRNIIANFYSNLSFQLKHEYLQSYVRTQSSGIRQGCPFSTFLFVFVMIVLFHDIGIKYSRDLIDNQFDHVRFNEVFYADDF